MKVCICAHLCNRYLHPYLRIRVGMKHVELLAYVHRSCLQVAIVMMMIMMHMCMRVRGRVGGREGCHYWEHLTNLQTIQLIQR